MSTEMKPGSRWQSTTCATEVVVVKAPTRAVVLNCGGAPMAPAGTHPESNPLDPHLTGGTALGKRYTDDETGIELLCVTPGKGSLAIGERALTLKESKPLPSSD